ncbi:MAG: beta-lactamase family protein, partial [Acidobacteriota bacterium]|nr:beta-lactamase family protein [Acidobacteriota bacterium]
MRLKLKLRQKIIFSLAATLILSSAFSYFVFVSHAQIVNQVNAKNTSSQQKYRATIAMLDAFIRREMTDKELPGVSIALVDDQKIVWQQGYGFSDPKAKTPITADTVFRVGSVSKLFTDIAVMRLVEQGKLDLDAPVTNYLPDFKPHNSFGKPITLRQLMSHQAGLVREPPVGSYFDSSSPTLAETVKSLNQTALVYAPETRLKYSNAGLATVGYVLEKTQKQLFAGYLKHHILDPLGMKNTSFKPTPEITKNLAKAEMWTVFGKTFETPTFELGIAPAGSMYTTTTDLAGFASRIFNANSSLPGAFLKKETLEKMWTPQFAAPGQKTGAGIGFFMSEVEGHRSVGHGGAIYGFSTQLGLLPEDKLGVIVVSTEDVSNGVTTRIADVALKSMLAERENKPLPQPEITAPIKPAIAKKIAGRYAGVKNSYDLIERGGKLVMINSAGGFELRLRSLGSELVVDDKLGFGTRVKPNPEQNSITIGRDTYKRVETPKPTAANEKFRNLIGEYGPDHDITYIFERDGKLWVLIEQVEFDQLEQVSENVFNFPKTGLYHGEQIVFKPDKSGKVTQMIAAGVTFK